MRKEITLENVSAVVVMLCAITAAVSYVTRRDVNAGDSGGFSPTYLEEWREEAEQGDQGKTDMIH